MMVPLRRCGSHALRLRLNRSSEFHSPYPIHVVDYMPVVAALPDLADDRAFFTLVVGVIGLLQASPDRWTDVAFDPRQVFEVLQQGPRAGGLTGA